VEQCLLYSIGVDGLVVAGGGGEQGTEGEILREARPEAKPIDHAFHKVQGRPVGARFCGATSSMTGGSPVRETRLP
jgi:hypothetical protein